MSRWLGLFAVALSGVVSAQEAIKVGVLTHDGGAHLDIYFRTLAELSDVGSVTLADPDGASEATARTALGDKLDGVYKDWSAMLAAEKPAMVIVSVEAVRGPEAIAAALDAGAHVFAEKPACVSAEDFAPLVAKADTKGLHLMLALANRSNPEVLEAKRLIGEGALGTLYGVEMNLIQDQTRLTRESYHHSWFADKDRAGGGHLTWLGIHWLDLAMFVTDSPIVAVTGFTGNVGGQPIGVEDSAAVAMRFENGVFGTLTSGYYLDKGMQSHLKIWGEKGRIEIDSGRPAVVTLYGDEPAVTEIERPAGFDPYRDYIGAAVRASMGQGEPPITGEESLRVLKAVYGVYEGAESGTALE